MKGETNAELELRLLTLEAEVADLRRRLSSEHASPVALDVPDSKYTLQARFENFGTERMPYSLSLGIPECGVTIRRSLTPVRAAILLVLLLELLERSENEQPPETRDARVRRALLSIDRHAHDGGEGTPDSLRVALYRTAQFLTSEFGEHPESGVSLGIERSDLVLRVRGEVVRPECITVELTSADRVISSFLEHSLASSPLNQLRKMKALYVAPGEHGQDRLLLEILDHEFPVRQTTLFYRPTIQGFPPALLAKLNLSPNRRRRQAVALQAYQSGRLQYTEILQRQVLWDLVRRVPGTQLSRSGYPPDFSTADIIEHLEHLISLLRTMSGYELILTDAFFPFYINALEIARPGGVERLVLFFQQAEHDNIREVSVFGVRDDAVFFSSHERVIQWVLSHPTTKRKRHQVIEELEGIRDTLSNASHAQEPAAVPQLNPSWPVQTRAGGYSR